MLMHDPASRELTAADFAPLTHGRGDGGEAIGVGGEAVEAVGTSLSTLERNAIAASIAKHDGNLSLVAKELGISRGALYRKIEKHGL